METKVKTEKLSLFLQDNGASLLRIEHKNEKKKSGPLIYIFERDEVFDSILDLWEQEKRKYLFD